MPLGKLVPSLHPGSVTTYWTGQIRTVSPGKVRIQGQNWEETQYVTPALCTYIEALPHTGKSIAVTNTMYASCQFRPDGSGPGKVRVQIAGPALNRPWGVEFILGVTHYSNMPKVSPSDPVALGPPMEEPSSFLAKIGKGKRKECANCGLHSGRHYPGGANLKFNPTLCPQPDAICPACGPVGPMPLPIHLAHACYKLKPVGTDAVPF